MTDEFATRLEKRKAQLDYGYNEMVPVITAVVNTVTSLFDMVMRYAQFIESHDMPLDRDNGYLNIHLGAIKIQVPLRCRPVIIHIKQPPFLRLGDYLSPESISALDFYECNPIEIEPGTSDFSQFRSHAYLELFRSVNERLFVASGFTSLIEDAFILQLEELLA